MGHFGVNQGLPLHEDQPSSTLLGRGGKGHGIGEREESSSSKKGMLSMVDTTHKQGLGGEGGGGGEGGISVRSSVSKHKEVGLI